MLSSALVAPTLPIPNAIPHSNRPNPRLPPMLMDELGEEVLGLPPVLLDELVEEVLLRLPPDEPAWLVRASAVCKPWRCILAAPRFRRRYREFHRTPPLLGFFKDKGHFLPTSSLLPAQPDRPGWTPMDCRHGRVLLAPSDRYLGPPSYLAVLDPVRRLLWQVPSPDRRTNSSSAAVLCAAQGCNHHGCQGGHFVVAMLTTNKSVGIVSGWLYSSETGVRSKLTPELHCTNTSRVAGSSVLVGDALYFNIGAIIKCELGTLSLSMFEKPIDGNGRLMTLEDGGLGFAAVVDVTNLTLWSMETGSKGAMGWAKLRVIDLKTLLPDGALSIPEHGINRSPAPSVSAVAEGTQVIFVRTYFSCYMVELKSGQVRNVPYNRGRFFPYMSFYIPAMEAASPDQGQ